MHRYLFFILMLAGTSLPALSQTAEEPTVVMVFRHAETMHDQGRDPSLSEAGQQRAQALIDVVGSAEVRAIYSSQLKRTQETVAPLAAHLNIPVTTAEVSRATLATYATELAETILAKHRGETVVVVNHSNTVPPIVEALGGVPMPEITESEYHHFILVVVPASGPVRTIRARYGQ